MQKDIVGPKGNLGVPKKLNWSNEHQKEHKGSYSSKTVEKELSDTF